MMVHTSEETGSSTVSTAQSRVALASAVPAAGSPKTPMVVLSKSTNVPSIILKSTSSAASNKLDPAATSNAAVKPSGAVILLTANAVGNASTTSEISAVSCASTKSTMAKIPEPLIGKSTPPKLGSIGAALANAVRSAPNNTSKA